MLGINNPDELFNMMDADAVRPSVYINDPFRMETSAKMNKSYSSVP
jgi:hypothetical protein